MAPAELPFLLAFSDVALSAPRVPVVSGYSARPFCDVPRELSRALVAPVRWRETMATLVALGARRFVDVGPGEVLTRLVRRNVVSRRVRSGRLRPVLTPHLGGIAVGGR